MAEEGTDLGRVRDDSLIKVSEETLLILRANLLNGLDLVAASLADGTFHKVGKKGMAPPSQAGQLTLGMLVSVNNELVARGHRTIFVEG
jgi:hypothetical protein